MQNINQGGMSGNDPYYRAFNEWWQSEANPAYQRLVKLENIVSGAGGLKESVDILDGKRNRQVKRRAAVRFEDLRFLSELASYPPKARKAAGATVTVDEFNRLVDDLNELYYRLGSVAMIIQRGLG